MRGRIREGWYYLGGENVQIKNMYLDLAACSTS